MAGELLLRFVVGGGLIVLVTLLAKTRYPMLAGIFMLFPVVTLVSYYFVGQSMSVAQLQQVTKFSIYALSTTFIFLVTLYHAQKKYSLNAALGAATTMWFVASGALIGVTHA